MRVVRYDLDLDLDFANEAFRGEVAISGSGAADPAEFDCGELTIDSVEHAGTPVPFRLDATKQKLTLGAVDLDAAPVRIRYGGKARRDVLNGVYVSKLGGTKVITTMMEPVGCRWLVPCIDDPLAKAVFRVRVTTEAGLAVISNAAEESVANGGARATWTFAPTPPMSTYLVYLGVGPFESKSAVDDGVTVVVATAPGQVEKARPALEMTGPLLRGYRDYFGVGYALPKLHLVAVPDLWAGGMENWGAIVIPEIGLLWDRATSPAIRRWATETISHEVAHQWFGNLVTMRTWNDLWLNESFATFIAARMQEILRLRTDPWAEFLIRTSPGYASDSLRSTHPVQMDIHDPAEISQSTDDITYFKGANIVRMIAAYLGEPVFQRGLRAYFQKFQFGNATSNDLWSALEEASHEPVQRVMRAWVDRPGHPALRVHRTPSGVRLEQARFAFSGETFPDPPWPIPLRIQEGESSRTVLFDTATTDVPLADPVTARFNPDRTAFLRVWYEPALRRDRRARLLHLPSTDRWAFVNDTAAFVLAGDYAVTDLLATVDAVRAATDYPTVSAVLGALDFHRTYLPETERLAETSLNFCHAQWDRLGDHPVPGEPDTNPVLRESLALALVDVDPAFAAAYAARFGEVDTADAALRPALARAYAAAGGPDAVDVLYDRILHAASHDAIEQAAFALEGLPTEAMLSAALARCLAPEIRSTHTEYIVAGIASNRLGRDATWAWMQANLRAFETKAEGSWWLSRLLEATIPAVGLVNEEEVRAYFARETFPEGANGMRKGLEMLGVISALRARQLGRAA